jgi:hypothetical protein
MARTTPDQCSFLASLKRQRRSALPGLLAATAFALAGCSAAREQIESAQATYAAGNPEAAYQLLASDQGLRDETREGLLWRLEEGKMAQDAGHFVESWNALGEASVLADRFDLEWQHRSIGEELGSIAINDRVRDFRGSYADRIAMECARVIAALSRRDAFGAAIAAKRIVERQRDAEVEQAKRIQEVDQEISKRGGTGVVNDLLAREGVDLSTAYAAYLNPLGSWLSGMLQCSTGDGNDRQRGETELRRALAMMPENAALLAQVEHNPYDLARAGQPQVVVLFENGLAPRLDQITIPLVTPWLGLSTIPIPRQVRIPRPAFALDVTGRDGQTRTTTLADYDRIWERDFKQRLPEIILRTVLMVAAKEGATFAASEPFRRKRQRGEDSAVIGELAVLIGASIYKYATNKVDLRSWRSVPAEVQLGQLPRPADNAVTLSLVSPSGVAFGTTRVDLPDAPVTLVWVRAAVQGQLIARAVPLQATYVVPEQPDASPSEEDDLNQAEPTNGES